MLGVRLARRTISGGDVHQAPNSASRAGVAASAASANLGCGARREVAQASQVTCEEVMVLAVTDLAALDVRRRLVIVIAHTESNSLIYALPWSTVCKIHGSYGHV